MRYKTDHLLMAACIGLILVLAVVIGVADSCG